MLVGLARGSTPPYKMALNDLDRIGPAGMPRMPVKNISFPMKLTKRRAPMTTETLTPEKPSELARGRFTSSASGP